MFSAFIVALILGQSITPRVKPDYLLPYTPPPPKPAEEIPHHAPTPEPKPAPVQSQSPMDTKSLSQEIAQDVSQKVMASQAQLQESVARTQAAVAELTKSVAALADMQVLSNAKNAVPKVEAKKFPGKYGAPDNSGQWWYDDDPEVVKYAVEYYNRRIAGIPVRQATQQTPSAGSPSQAPQAAPASPYGSQAAPYGAPGGSTGCYSASPPPATYGAPPATYGAPAAGSYAAPVTASTSCYSGAAQAMSYAAPSEVYAAIPSFAAPSAMGAPGLQVETYRRGLFGRERRSLINLPGASAYSGGASLFGSGRVCIPGVGCFP